MGSKIQSFAVIIVLAFGAWIVSSNALTPAVPTASAHTTVQPWKCKYLMWTRAINGSRYQWRMRCERYTRTHIYQHKFGFDVGHCFLSPPSEYRRRCVISGVFASVGQSRNALRVAWCESRYRPNAQNGQYRGVFQMGSYERSKFGHGNSTLSQARAALRYYKIAGWRPWECKP